MTYLILDYETRSEVDLKTVGAYEYARHPSTEILCVAWKVIGENKTISPTRVWSPLLGNGDRPSFLKLMYGIDAKLVAHNAFFEQMITRFVLTKYYPYPELKWIPHDRWICTASLGAMWALPRKLEGACLALKLTNRKDMVGHKLMLKMSKPRRATKNDKSKWHESREDLLRLMKYCAADVDAEGQLLLTLPPLSEFERKIWLLDQKINFRGFKIDTELVDAALTLTAKEGQILNVELKELTNGRVQTANEREKLLRCVRRAGFEVPNLQAGTIKDALIRDDLPPLARRLLEIRANASKTSTAKYAAFKARVGHDERVRDNLLYSGATPTARWSGMGVQVQNLPRGTIKDLDADLAVEVIKIKDLELLRLIYGNPLEVLSSCLRSVIISGMGDELFCEDFSAIEARVLLWLADDQRGLDIFRRGEDPYWHMACKIYGRIVAKKGLERELGKRAELGCGYNMGWKKFIESCKQYADMVIDAALSKKTVAIYREVHAPVTKMWAAVERAALYAVSTGKKVTVNKVTWFTDGKILYCKLPSGRKMAYYEPQIKYKETPWGKKRATLYHWNQNSLTRKWELENTYGGKLVENIVQGTARDFMAEAMLRVDEAKYNLTLTVHDELLAERKRGLGSQKEFSSLVAKIPEWGKGCPITTEGWQGVRYKK